MLVHFILNIIIDKKLFTRIKHNLMIGNNMSETHRQDQTLNRKAIVEKIIKQNLFKELHEDVTKKLEHNLNDSNEY